MIVHRECDRCKGEEFLLTGEAGAVAPWRDKSGKSSYWFCPNCDWGDEPPDTSPT